MFTRRVRAAADGTNRNDVARASGIIRLYQTNIQDKHDNAQAEMKSYNDPGFLRYRARERERERARERKIYIYI